MIDDILRNASKMGACAKTVGITDWHSLSHLFFSPQGREFCAKNNFPSLEMFRAMKPFGIEAEGVYVDAGHVRIANKWCVALIGDTTGEICCRDPKAVYKLILMHGATAHIRATNYAVIHIENIGNCPVTIDADQTVRLL